MIAMKTHLLMVMGLEGRENGGKAKNCLVLRRVLARYVGILDQKTSLSINWHLLLAYFALRLSLY